MEVARVCAVVVLFSPTGKCKKKDCEWSHRPSIIKKHQKEEKKKAKKKK